MGYKAEYRIIRQFCPRCHSWHLVSSQRELGSGSGLNKNRQIDISYESAFISDNFFLALTSRAAARGEQKYSLGVHIIISECIIIT